MEARNWLIGPSPGHRAQNPQRADEEEHHVDPDLSGLEPAAEPSETAAQPGRTIDRRVVDHTLIHTLPEHYPRQPDEGPDYHPVVQLVDVILPVEHQREAGLRRSVMGGEDAPAHGDPEARHQSHNPDQHRASDQEKLG